MHLIPLAAAMVERRGGMLIHGAIIAREMRIPCVNGVARAVELPAKDYLRAARLGPHVCLGEALSTIIMTTMLACILRRYCVSLPLDQPDVEPVVGVVVSPASDLRFIVRRLDSAEQRREL